MDTKELSVPRHPVKNLSKPGVLRALDKLPALTMPSLCGVLKHTILKFSVKSSK